MLRRYIPKGSVELWGARFIKSLLSITNKQWLYRNSHVHHVIDGLSARQHQELTARIHYLLETKKDSLHEQHKHVANVEMAISVAKVARDNSCTKETLLLLQTPLRKTSSHLWKKEVHFHTPSMHIGTPTVKQPRISSLCHAACYSRLSKSPFCYSRTYPHPLPLSKQQSILPARI